MLHTISYGYHMDDNNLSPQSWYERVYPLNFEVVLWDQRIDFAKLTRGKAMPEWWAIVYSQKCRNITPNSNFRCILFSKINFRFERISPKCADFRWSLLKHFHMESRLVCQTYRFRVIGPAGSLHSVTAQKAGYIFKLLSTMSYGSNNMQLNCIKT